MRTLTWYVAHPPLGSGQWETYRMDGDYRPVRAWVHFDQAPTVEEIMIDLKADGESRTTISVERSVFKRERILWMDNDEPVKTEDRTVEKHLLSAIGKSF